MHSWRELALAIPVALLLLALTAGAAMAHQAAALRCGANLKEVYRMALCYAQDNDGFIVRHLEIKRPKAVFWPEQLRIYARDFSDFSCPANAAHGADAFVQDDLLPARFALAKVSFGINGHISGLDQRNRGIERISFIKNPAYLVFFGDSNTMRLRATGKLWAQDWAPVHERGIQAVMADGSVRTFTRETLGTYGQVKGWQRDPARWKNWKKNNSN